MNGAARKSGGEDGVKDKHYVERVEARLKVRKA